MSNIIGGGQPSCKSKFPRGNVTKQNEVEEAIKRAACLARHKANPNAYRYKKYKRALNPQQLKDRARRLEYGFPLYSDYQQTADVDYEYVQGRKKIRDDQRQFEAFDSWSDTRLVSEIAVGSQDVTISNSIRGGKTQSGGGKRQAITEWSTKSRARCEKHIRNVPDGSIKYFLTLTYPLDFPSDGLTVKRDLSTIRKRLRRMGVHDDIWFLEFQSRGAPHIHMYLSQYPVGGIKAISQAWYEVVGSGDPKHLDFHLGKLSGRPCLEAMRNPHAASYYAVKYVVKSDQKDVPKDYVNVGRFWGYGGELKPVYQTYFVRGYNACRSAIKMIAVWKFQKFGGIVDSSLTLYSATLRGCSAFEIGQLISMCDWGVSTTPDYR